jgi:hypothetical protein
MVRLKGGLVESTDVDAQVDDRYLVQGLLDVGPCMAVTAYQVLELLFVILGLMGNAYLEVMDQLTEMADSERGELFDDWCIEMGD